MSQVIHVVDKWDDYVIEADDLDKAALGLLQERHNQGFWYYDEDAQEAAAILDSQNGIRAWAFLESRSDYEYEYVSLDRIKSYE
jgi:hypothetical protein